VSTINEKKLFEQLQLFLGWLTFRCADNTVASSLLVKFHPQESDTTLPLPTCPHAEQMFQPESSIHPTTTTTNY